VVLLERLLSARGQRAVQNPFDPGGLSGSPCNPRSPFIILGKGVIFARAPPLVLAPRRLPRLNPGKPLVDIGNKPDPAHLTVRRDVDPSRSLFLDGFPDSALTRCVIHG